jgi:hypothetical protein
MSESEQTTSFQRFPAHRLRTYRWLVTNLSKAQLDLSTLTVQEATTKHTSVLPEIHTTLQLVRQESQL